MISHGGGISGFTTESRYYPDDDLYVIVLINTAGPAAPTAVAQGITKVVLGPGKETAGLPFTGDLTPFAGQYRGVGRGVPTNVTVTVEGGSLQVKGMGPARTLLYLGGDTFGAGSARYTFSRDGGKVNAVRVDAISVVSLARRIE